MRPERPLGRFSTPDLAVPGVLGVLSYYGLHYVQLGPDAGWPVPQHMLDWKSDYLLIDKRTLPLRARSLLGQKLPDEQLAEALALNADMAFVDAPLPYEEEELTELRLADSARLWLVPPGKEEALLAQGAPVYGVGYSRVTSHLRLGATREKKLSHLWISEPDEPFVHPPEPPPGVPFERLREFIRAVWLDRALRALSLGMISEGAVHAARACDSRFWNRMPLLKDDVFLAALEAANRMNMGADTVTLPLHGRAVRVRLPPFRVRCEDSSPFGPRTEPMNSRSVIIPAENAWLITGP